MKFTDKDGDWFKVKKVDGGFRFKVSCRETVAVLMTDAVPAFVKGFSSAYTDNVFSVQKSCREGAGATVFIHGWGVGLSQKQVNRLIRLLQS